MGPLSSSLARQVAMDQSVHGPGHYLDGRGKYLPQGK
jgi:hypothetical protein